jgi:hypothetical protein
MQRWWPNARVRSPGAQLLLQQFKARQEAPHPQVGVHPLLVAAAVRCPPERFHRNPAEPLVRQAHPKLRRLGDDRRVRGVVPQYLGHADACFFLVGNTHHQQVPS